MCDYDDNCAGIIDGGVDTIKPIQIWDSLMKKYLYSLFNLGSLFFSLF